MPSAGVTHSNGTTPVIPAAAARTSLVLQNNSDVAIYVRLYGEVSASDPAKAGLRLAPGGGMMALSGKAAQQAVRAIHNAGSGVTKNLTYETDIE
jgi:hypothetical protein